MSNATATAVSRTTAGSVPADPRESVPEGVPARTAADLDAPHHAREPAPQERVRGVPHRSTENTRVADDAPAVTRAT